MFAGQTIAITGAGSGIGAALARAACAQGARLVLIDRDAAALGDAARDLAIDKGDLLLSAQDVSDPGGWQVLRQQVLGRFGGLSHLVAAAGVGHPPTEIVGLSVETWRRTMAVNLDGAFLALQAGIELIRAAGGGGAIILLSSSTAFRVQPRTAAYAVSKSALVQLARIAATEVAADNIRVNAIAPGLVETPLFRTLDWFNDLARDCGSEAEAFRVVAKRTVPLGRPTSADETAAQILFLLGPAGATITGTTLNADGGLTLSPA
jgi:NAD(P)-dependent dehydrogenase (short-subunit alcohol dehydrogenase family)